MRLALVLCSLVLLAGCNVLMTQHPLFSRADEVGAPQMRPGVWAPDAAADCPFDESKPITDWPGCASGFVVVRGGVIGEYNHRNGRTVWETTPYILAAGDPLITQARMSGDITPGQPVRPAYVYGVIVPTRLDEQARIIATRSWVVMCGPPPPADAKNADGSQRYGTLTPLPGLAMDAMNNNCTTDSRDAARAAGRASQAWATASGGSVAREHWVREGVR